MIIKMLNFNLNHKLKDFLLFLPQRLLKEINRKMYQHSFQIKYLCTNIRNKN